ncbi:MAG: cupin domain-containing protein [Candidatus Rariloculaceae bacterium]
MPNKAELVEEMEARTARFSELRASPQAFVDTRIPEHVRDIYNVIGRGVTEDPELEPSVTAVEGFNVTYIGADPQKGAALHSHPTVEVFVALTGRWIVYWGEDGDGETELGPMDLVSVPVGVMRGFRNISDEHAYLMAILGGDDAGHVDWAKSVLSRARETGLELGADGNLSA